MTVEEAFKQNLKGCTIKAFGKKYLIQKIDINSKAHLYDLETKRLLKVSKQKSIVQAFQLRPDDQRIINIGLRWHIKNPLNGQDDSPLNPLNRKALTA